MLNGGIRAACRVMGGAAILAAVVSGMIGVPIANAAQKEVGIGVQYSAPIRYIKVCGEDQYNETVCMAGPVAESSSTPPYQTAWFVTGSEVIYASSPPTVSPQWWWQGTVHIWTYSSTTSQTAATYTGDTVCVIPASPSGNWVGCKFITVEPTPPPSSPPPPAPTPTPTPPVPTQPAPPTPPACQKPSATSQGLKLQAWVRAAKTARRHRTSITVRYRRRSIVWGTLLGSNGDPVGGATVCMTARNEVLGAGTLSIGTVTTDAHGRFSYAWTASRSQRLWLTSDASGGQASATVLAQVRASVSVRAIPTSLVNGQVMRLTGRLNGGPLPRGALVEMQVFRGTYWETFGTTNAGRGRTFSFLYRFTNTFTSSRYVFRAHVPTQPGDAFAAGSSRRVTVFVGG